MDTHIAQGPSKSINFFGRYLGWWDDLLLGNPRDGIVRWAWQCGSQHMLSLINWLGVIGEPTCAWWDLTMNEALDLELCFSCYLKWKSSMNLKLKPRPCVSKLLMNWHQLLIYSSINSGFSSQKFSIPITLSFPVNGSYMSSRRAGKVDTSTSYICWHVNQPETFLALCDGSPFPWVCWMWGVVCFIWWSRHFPSLGASLTVCKCSGTSLALLGNVRKAWHCTYMDSLVVP